MGYPSSCSPFNGKTSSAWEMGSRDPHPVVSSAPICAVLDTHPRDGVRIRSRGRGPGGVVSPRACGSASNRARYEQRKNVRCGVPGFPLRRPRGLFCAQVVFCLFPRSSTVVDAACRGFDEGCSCTSSSPVGAWSIAAVDQVLPSLAAGAPAPSPAACFDHVALVFRFRLSCSRSAFMASPCCAASLCRRRLLLLALSCPTC